MTTTHPLATTRPFGRTGWALSPIGFGAWAIGGSWGDVSDDDAKAALHAALDAGCDFIDTADVYGDGRSERLIRDVLAARGRDRPVVATKAGRRLDPHVASGYTLANLERFVDRSLVNLGTERLDLVQLHCPPSAVYGSGHEAFGAMDTLVERGKVRFWGVSVETIDQATAAIRHPTVSSVQIIYNLFRQRPADTFFRAAAAERVAVIVRVPLASGLLTGKFGTNSVFASDDHRNFNRNGEAFDVGETFSGVPYDVALEAVQELRPLVPADATMAQFALRWILMEDAVSVVIPGARHAGQAQANGAAGLLPPIPANVMEQARAIYARLIAPHVHGRW